MSNIDLRPYGLYWDLDPSVMTFPVPTDYRTAIVRKDGDKLDFYTEKGEGIMRIGLTGEIGRGGYGTAFSTNKLIDGKKTVVKIIKRDPSYSTIDVLVEVISQIIIVESTKDYHNDSSGISGPFAPRVYMFGKDDHNYYILNEQMLLDFKHVISSDNSSFNLKNSITQIGIVMDILYKKLQFNHRDFKPDNIMFNSDGVVRIIDYGFCCLKYGEMLISSGYPYPSKSLHNCNSQSRDMNALFYYFLNYTRYKDISCPLKRVMHALMYNKWGTPTNWANSYIKYNTKPDLPNMYPGNIYRTFLAIEFTDDKLCSDIKPEWAAAVAEINQGVITNLKNEEIAHLNTDKTIEFLKELKSPTVTKRIITLTKDERLSTFGKELMLSLSPKKKTDGGTKRSRNKNRFSRRR